MKNNCVYNLAAALAVTFLSATAGSSPEPDTDLDDLIMYVINNDPPVQLLRYSFLSDTYMVISLLLDQNGNIPVDLEAMCFVPSGPDKGFYASSNMNDKTVPAVLYKIDPLTGDCFKYTNNIGWPYVVGMVPVQDPATGNWSILATQGYMDDSKALIRINLASGLGTEIMVLNETYEGLAMDRDGTLYGIARDGENARLYTIDPSNGNENARGSTMNHGKTESLEFAFGNTADAINTAGIVPPSWTEDGVLMAFSDDENAFLIVNPNNGETVTYAPPFLAGTVTDVEGLVFFTSRTDPFGVILSDVFD